MLSNILRLSLFIVFGMFVAYFLWYGAIVGEFSILQTDGEGMITSEGKVILFLGGLFGGVLYIRLYGDFNLLPPL